MIFHDRNEPVSLSSWSDIGIIAMPEGEAVWVRAKDGGGIYRLPFKVVRRGAEVFHAEKGNLITLNLIQWSRVAAAR